MSEARVDRDGQWFYEADGRAVGPVDEAEVSAQIAAGRITVRTKVWQEGMADWQPAGETELAGLFQGDLQPLPLRPEDEPPSSVQTPISATENMNPASSPVDRSDPNAPSGVVRSSITTGSLKARWWVFAVLYGVGAALFHVIDPTAPPLEIQWPVAALLLPGWIVGLTLLYSYWKLIQDGRARTTPGKAVGFGFIPLFNFYWYFVAYHGLGIDMNDYCRERDIPAGPISPGLTLSLCILLCASILPAVIPSMAPAYKTVIGLITTVLMLVSFRAFTRVAVAIVEYKARLVAPA